MARTPSTYVCRRCGSPVTGWMDGWKHANGWHSETRSCGKPPLVITRVEYDRLFAVTDADYAAVRHALRDRVDVRPEPDA